MGEVVVDDHVKASPRTRNDSVAFPFLFFFFFVIVSYIHLS